MRCLLTITIAAVVKVLIYQVLFFFFFLSFVFFRATPTAHAGSQARGPIGVTAYARATATPDPSRVCDLHHSSRQRRIFNPLSKARDQTRNLMVPSWIHFHCTTTGTPTRYYIMLYNKHVISTHTQTYRQLFNFMTVI